LDIKAKVNPNTIEAMDAHYLKVKTERVNEWMFAHLLPLIPKSGSILDIGCGMGETLRQIKKRTSTKCTLTGIDISKVGIDKAKKLGGGDFYVQDAEKIEAIDKYDLIINSQTLEHVDSPSKIVKRMKQAVRVGGVLFITVPYPKSNLDNGVFKHWLRLYPKDFQEWLGNIEVIKPDKNHLIVIWKK